MIQWFISIDRFPSSPTQDVRQTSAKQVVPRGRSRSSYHFPKEDLRFQGSSKIQGRDMAPQLPPLEALKVHRLLRPSALERRRSRGRGTRGERVQRVSVQAHNGAGGWRGAGSCRWVVFWEEKECKEYGKESNEMFNVMLGKTMSDVR